jgi:hypothetical protein
MARRSGRAWLLVFFPAILAAEWGGAARADDEVVGAIWSFEATKGDQTEKGQFRVFEKKIYRADKLVGEVRGEDADETTMIFKEIPRLNGVAKLRKTRRQPPVWVGDLRREDGEVWKLRLEVKKK